MKDEPRPVAHLDGELFDGLNEASPGVLRWLPQVSSGRLTRSFGSASSCRPTMCAGQNPGRPGRPIRPDSGGGRGGDMVQAGVFSTGMRRYGTPSNRTGDRNEGWSTRIECHHPRLATGSTPVAEVAGECVLQINSTRN